MCLFGGRSVGEICIHISLRYLLLWFFFLNWELFRIEYSGIKSTLADWAPNLLLSIGPSSVGNCWLSWRVLFNPWLYAWSKSKYWWRVGSEKTCHWAELLLKMRACKYCVLQHSQKWSDTCRGKTSRWHLQKGGCCLRYQQPQKGLSRNLHSYTRNRNLILEGLTKSNSF